MPLVYNFRFTTLINTNKTSNYRSTNKTHHTQQNTTITTHIGSQLLILVEAIVLAQDRQVADACECGNEPSGSVKCGEFLDKLQTS